MSTPQEARMLARSEVPERCMPATTYGCSLGLSSDMDCTGDNLMPTYRAMRLSSCRETAYGQRAAPAHRCVVAAPARRRAEQRPRALRRPALSGLGADGAPA